MSLVEDQCYSEADRETALILLHMASGLAWSKYVNHYNNENEHQCTSSALNKSNPVEQTPVKTLPDPEKPSTSVDLSSEKPQKRKKSTQFKPALRKIQKTTYNISKRATEVKPKEKDTKWDHYYALLEPLRLIIQSNKNVKKEFYHKCVKKSFQLK